MKKILKVENLKNKIEKEMIEIDKLAYVFECSPGDVRNPKALNKFFLNKIKKHWNYIWIKRVMGVHDSI